MAEATLWRSLASPYYKLASSYRWTSWERLRRQGQLPVFKATMFFPLIAAVLSISRDHLIIPIIGVEVELSSYHILRLYLFYFSLLFLSLGSILFAVYCPEMIKRYENNLVYCQSELGILMQEGPFSKIYDFCTRRLRDFRDRVARYKPMAVERFERAIHQESFESMLYSGDARRKLSLMNPRKEREVLDLMLTHWDFMNWSHGLARVTTYVSFNIGIIVLASCIVLSVGEITWNFFDFIGRWL